MASPLTVWSSTADGRVRGYSDVYATAQSTAQSYNDATTSSYAGQFYLASYYYVYEGFHSFVTSDIPDDATITTATLSLYGDIDNSGSTAWDLRARIRDWGAALATDDWVAGNDLDTYTLVAHFDTSNAWSTTGYNALVNDALPANVSKTGTTYIMLHSSRQEDTAGGPYTPTGDEYVSYYHADQAGTDNDPRLYIEYTEGGAAFAGLTVTRWVG